MTKPTKMEFIEAVNDLMDQAFSYGQAGYRMPHGQTVKAQDKLLEMILLVLGAPNEAVVLVPVEPTEAMLDAAVQANMQHVIDCINDPTKLKELGSEEMCRQTYRARYKSMIAAATKARENPK